MGLRLIQIQFVYKHTFIKLNITNEIRQMTHTKTVLPSLNEIIKYIFHFYFYKCIIELSLNYFDDNIKILSANFHGNLKFFIEQTAIYL